jgi:hypothetical protein
MTPLFSCYNSQASMHILELLHRNNSRAYFKENITRRSKLLMTITHNLHPEFQSTQT